MSNRKKARIIMVLGTQSGAGKSLVATCLCRILRGRGLRVAPFKALNMSLNSTVTDSGEEIARAQWLQAIASGRKAEARFNPILLKPEGSGRSQLILLGRTIGSFTHEGYSGIIRERGRDAVTRSLNSLLVENDAVVTEGLGSPAEINLLDQDLANTFLMENYEAECILVGNIYNGGVFASILGTVLLVRRPDRIKWLLINNLAGDSAMLAAGIEELERRAGKPVIGVIPHMEVNLPGEDLLDYTGSSGGDIWIVKYPGMENYSDIDYLAFNRIGFRYVRSRTSLQGCRLLILPGSKNVASDLRFLRENGMDKMIMEAAGMGIPVLGICGGYQMLGESIADPEGIEEKGIIDGLKLLKVNTVYDSEKTVRVTEFTGIHHRFSGVSGKGYEIHFGRICNSGESTLFSTNHGDEGAVSKNGRIIGTNIHSVLSNSEFLSALTGERFEFTYDIDDEIDRISSEFLSHIQPGFLSGLKKHDQSEIQ